MSTSAPHPQVPAYRITLFYGPEPVEGSGSGSSCIFNVKKRSWKSGVQVVVQVQDAQLAAVRQEVGFDSWLKEILSQVDDDETEACASRAQDAFVQAVCALKLDLAIQAGLQQENRTLSGADLFEELNGVIPKQVHRLKTQVLTQLDLAE